jgi:hypothetical protein
MAWFHDYNRDYNRAAGYDRGRNARDTPGMRSSSYGDRGYPRGGYWGESSTRVDYNRDYLGRQSGYDQYDYQYRQRHPEQSPFYGRQADQEVQRWARRYGYDMQFEVNPRQSGGGGGRGQQQGGYSGGGQQGGYGSGRMGGYSGGGQQGGYSGRGQAGGYGQGGGYNRGNNW